MNTNNDQITMERAAVQTAVTVKLGLDVHAGQITVCRQDGGLVPKPAQRKSWPEFLRWVEVLAAGPVPVVSCYEAGPCGYGLHRQLTALGITNHVVVPQRWDAEGKRVKTDARDARELCDRLDRYVRGNAEAFSVVRVPTPEQEQRRALGRQRGTLVKERQRCVVNAIIKQANPQNVLTNFQAVVESGKKTITTNFPAALLPDLAELGMKAKNAKLRSLVLSPDTGFVFGHPDWDKVRSMVKKSLQETAADNTAAPSAPATPSVPATSPSAVPSGSSSGSATPSATPTTKSEDLEDACAYHPRAYTKK